MSHRLTINKKCNSCRKLYTSRCCISHQKHSMTLCYLNLITLLILVLANSKVVHAISNNVTDQRALFSFKASITDDPLSVVSSWNNSIHFCHWKGVTCSLRHQRVTSLNLSSQHLVGTLSSHIGNLSFLREIDLRHNNFHGSIPNEIGRLFRLQYLTLGNNSFQGEFPANLSHCLDIRYINIFGNDLKGKLPTEFTSWSKLYWFSLGSNYFTGHIPPSVGNMSSLRSLDLRSNKLTGGIPLEVAHLTKLEVIVLSENSLSSVNPLPLYNMSSLYVVGINDNGFEETIPTDLGFTIPKLQDFYVGGNRFFGPLPSSITNASNLVAFDMGDNYIAGPIPMNWGSLSNLRELNLGGNPLGNNQLPNDLSFFDSLVNCTHLRVLGVYDNGLRGNLPKSIVNISTTIEILDLFGNQIYGSIPREIGKLVNLTRLSLSHNYLTGSIPESIGELTKLGILSLGKNNISGAIPTSISNNTQLVVFSLHNNMLHGSIPTGLFNISTLQELYLSNSGLGGVIPEQIVGLSRCVLLLMNENLFTGPLPSNIGRLKQLVRLYVSDNKLTGNIPATLGGCVMLEELRMEGNQFEGRIPISFSALKSLVLLDLSSNSISETIPRFFDGYHLIKFLNLSHNKLRGEVPRVGLFSNISLFSVVGNLWLCGGIQALQLPACPVKISTNQEKTFSRRIILLIVLLPLAILLTCLAFISYRRRKSKLMNVPVPVLQDNPYPRLSYQDLLIATNEFSLNNLLGEGKYGSVYIGTLKLLEQPVAVKVLNVEVHGANKSFLAECETLKNIRHRNLIKIITACSSIDFKGNDFKALVFELMTNGSLDKWLHPSPSDLGTQRNLTLVQRLNISIDVALGIDYLHHHSHTKIIHCDIKPSNILLDEELGARVGDFGLARFPFTFKSDVNQAQMSSTGVRGTVGYVPPEYGMGAEVSAEGDVYSYGILLLEMFSGKRPTCSSILMDNGNNIHDYVKKALPYRVMDIADPLIVLDQEEHGLTGNQSYSTCLASIFEVGILCSVETPRERLDISVAIKHLNVAKDKLLQHN